jgi:hypothetical protein
MHVRATLENAFPCMSSIVYWDKTVTKQHYIRPLRASSKGGFMCFLLLDVGGVISSSCGRSLLSVSFLRDKRNTAHATPLTLHLIFSCPVFKRCLVLISDTTPAVHEVFLGFLPFMLTWHLGLITAAFTQSISTLLITI